MFKTNRLVKKSGLVNSFSNPYIDNIKRYRDVDVNATSRHNIMNKKYKQQNNTASSSNYYQPLQTIDDDDNESEKNLAKPSKVQIPPITILKCKILQLHEICKILKITKYAIRKISIGLKIFCDSKEDFNLLCEHLKSKYEYFTYGSKNEKPYKAVLLGFDKFDPLIIKKKLTDLKLSCIDVKLVTKSNGPHNEQAIYIIYFERKSITMKELRQNYSIIDHIKVKWDFQRKRSTRITQCYNCQMLGHGSSRCNVKTFCANCAGNHKTTDCKSDTIKCANCNKAHKSFSSDCESRIKYAQMRQRSQPRAYKPREQPFFNNVRFNNNETYNTNFPNNLNQGFTTSNHEWRKDQNTNTSNLFSPEEIKNLTLELITKLQGCKSKADQFEVITSLACKFLYE